MAGVTIAWTIVTLFSPSDAAIVIAARALGRRRVRRLPRQLRALLGRAGCAGRAAGGVQRRLASRRAHRPPRRHRGRRRDRARRRSRSGPPARHPRPTSAWRRSSPPRAAGWTAILNAYSDDSDRRLLRPTRLAARRARVEAWDSVRRALAEPPRRRPDARPLRAVLTAMDDMSESALVLAAAVHDGARAPREALAPYLTALSGSFDEIAASIRDGTWASPALPRNDTLALVGRDPTLPTVAAEATSVLGSLERLERTLRRARASRPTITSGRQSVDHSASEPDADREVPASAFLCSRVLSSSCGCEVVGVAGWARPTSLCVSASSGVLLPGARPAGAERGALDRRRAGAIGVVCARPAG